MLHECDANSRLGAASSSPSLRHPHRTPRPTRTTLLRSPILTTSGTHIEESRGRGRLHRLTSAFGNLCMARTRRRSGRRVRCPTTPQPWTARQAAPRLKPSAFPSERPSRPLPNTAMPNQPQARRQAVGYTQAEQIPAKHKSTALHAWACCFANAAVTGSDRRPSLDRGAYVRSTNYRADRDRRARCRPAASSRLSSLMGHERMVRAARCFNKRAHVASRPRRPAR